MKTLAGRIDRRRILEVSEVARKVADECFLVDAWVLFEVEFVQRAQKREDLIRHITCQDVHKYRQVGIRLLR